MSPPAVDDQAGTACRPSRRPVDWHWATPQAQRILTDGHLGKILRFHPTIQEATLQRLPHQLQRITRIAGGLLPDIRIAASQALEWLREELAA